MDLCNITAEQALKVSQRVKEGTYWQAKLSGDWEKSEFPPDRQVVEGSDFVGTEIVFPLPVAARLLKISGGSAYRLHMVLAAGVLVLLGKYTGGIDLVVGMPIYRQDVPGEMTKQLLNRVLVLRQRLRWDMTFKELLLGVRDTVVEAVEHQNYPLEAILYKLKDHVARSDEFPLFDVVVLLEAIHDKSYLDGIPANTLFCFRGGERGEPLAGRLEYNEHRYGKEAMEMLAARFLHLLGQLLEDVDIKISRADLFTRRDKERLLSAINERDVPYDRQKTITTLYEEQVEKNPARIALGRPRQTTYRELNRGANRLARELRSWGGGPGKSIAFLAGQGPEDVPLIMVILSILKAGSAYLPVDPEAPEERIRTILEDAVPFLALVSGRDRGEFAVTSTSQSGPVWCRTSIDGKQCIRGAIKIPGAGGDDNLELINKLDDPAYVMFTSGSAGAPKGVVICHEGVHNLVVGLREAVYKRYEEEKKLNVALVAPCFFDASVKQIFGALLQGHCLIPVEKEVRQDGAALLEFYAVRCIDISDGTPELLRLLLASAGTRHEKPARHFLIGGEVLPRQLAASFFRTFTPGEPSRSDPLITNVYGPTECTVDATAYEITRENVLAHDMIPIGKPMSNTRVYILGRDNHWLPAGVPGEICIVGPGVGKGYLNNPERTSEKFDNDLWDLQDYQDINYRSYRSHITYKTYYRTGDLARWQMDGNIRFLGRRDHQVKIRGHRVELGEIRHCLLKSEMVNGAVVTVREDGSGASYLCAYVAAGEAAGANNSSISGLLKAHLSRYLPDYMIPTYIVPVAAFPLKASGKIDMGVLPRPGVNGAMAGRGPADELEELLVRLWSELLGVEEGSLGMADNFFERGGHSLKATIMIARLHQALKIQVPLKEVFNAPTLSGLAEYIRGSGKTPFSLIPQAEKREYYPLTPGMRRLYFEQKMVPGGTVYVITSTVVLEGVVDREKLERVFRQLVARHQGLRSSFHQVRHEPMQRIHRQVELGIRYSEARDADKWSPASAEKLVSDFVRPFDLSRAPLMRVGLIRFSHREYVLVVDIHHMVVDGTSMGILMKEFMMMYGGRKPPGLRIQYKDYSLWRECIGPRDVLERRESYWQEQLAGGPPELALPTDFPRPAIKDIAGWVSRDDMGAGEIRCLKEFARTHDVTLYMLLSAIYFVVLGRLANQEDIVVGTPVAGRRNADLQRIVGMFVKTLPFRNYPARDKTFSSFLQEVKTLTLRGFENQDFDFQGLVKKVAEERNPGRSPLFDSLFALQNMDVPEMEITGLKLRPYEKNVRRESRFDMSFVMVEDGPGLQIMVEYSTRLFKEITIRRFIGYFKVAAAALTAGPGAPLGCLEIMPDQEKERLLLICNGETRDYPVQRPLTELFAREAVRTPHRAALVGRTHAVDRQGITLTFRELDARSTGIAGELEQKGTGPGSIVGLMMDRWVEAVIALLGILKTGSAYLPIDPAYPAQRLKHILKDSGAAPVLTDDPPDPSAKMLPTGRSVNKGELPPAYVIYTSGTSGVPRGVVIGQGAVINLIYGLKEQVYRLYIGPLRLAMVSPLAFDASGQHIFAALLLGHTLCVVPEENRFDGGGLMDFYIRHAIDISDGTPSHLKMIHMAIEEGRKRHGLCVKHLIIGGERLDAKTAGVFAEGEEGGGPVITNVYGPTECCINSTAYRLPVYRPDRGETIPIGVPLPNQRVYIVDGSNRVQPVNTAGQLLIGGAGLARGYLNRPALTAERFVFHKAYGRIYKTGDLARWHEEGFIEFLGRLDRQVKIRGNRVELGEIEACLSKHPEVGEGLVVEVCADRDPGGGYLCGYLVGRGGELDMNDIRAHLSRSLPHYMVPPYLQQLEKLPLSVNGKIDTKALPDPRTGVKGHTGVREQGRDNVERLLAQVWQEVLEIEEPGIDESFFALGGDSIKIIQVASRLRGRGLRLEVKDLFANPTIRMVRPLVKPLRQEQHPDTVLGEAPLTPVQIRFFQANPGDCRHYNQAVMIYREQGFYPDMIRRVWDILVRHHDALYMVFKRGPAGTVTQENQEPGPGHCHLQVFHLENKTSHTLPKEIETLANRIHQGIDPEKGPLVKLGLFKTSAGDHLLMVIHHLVVDGVSWRILLEDMETAYERVEKGEPVQLPAKTHSFKEWASQLSSFVRGGGLSGEADYWRSVLETAVPDLPVDHADVTGGGFKFGDGAAETMIMGEEETRWLLKEANRAYRTEINDILLTALGIAFQRWAGVDRILVDLESHGREPLIPGLEISRTVGWFTALYPVLIDTPPRATSGGDFIAAALMGTKEMLRRIPNKGAGYGPLHYLTANGQPPPPPVPPISFNYLGQFSPGRAFVFSPMKSGRAIGPGIRGQHMLNVSGLVEGGRLRMAFIYNKKQYANSRITALAGHYRAAFQEILRHCRTREKSVPTPSDLGYEKISIRQLADITRHLEKTVDRGAQLERIYPVTPMQWGMLNETLKNPGATVYNGQFVFHIRGVVDPPLLEEALNRVVSIFEPLRSVLVYKQVDVPLQTVLKKRRVRLLVENFEGADPQRQEERLHRWIKKHRRQKFHLDRDILVRPCLVKTGEQAYRLVWTTHHILMDGWSMGILLKELLSVYKTLRSGQSFVPAAVTSYGRFAQWLNSRDSAADLGFWGEYLSGMMRSTALSRLAGTGTGGEGEKDKDDEYQKGEYPLIIDNGTAAPLEAAVREYGVTINTFFRTAWGVLLQKYLHCNDVVFGAVVSGRPPEIEGIERMVGLFINTVPVRVTKKPVKNGSPPTFAQLLMAVHRDAVRSKPHEYVSLAEIGQQTNIRGPLIDHVMVFENYPLQRELQTMALSGELGFEISHFDSDERSEYPLGVIVIPYDGTGANHSFRVILNYNTQAYSGEFIQRLGENFKEVLEQAAGQPGIPLGEIILSQDLLTAVSTVEEADYEAFGF
jgi:bacitracin synthase 1